MVNIFRPKPDAEEQIFYPFGPVMGYKKLSAKFVSDMNAFFDKDFASMTDYSDQLVGKVKQELFFTDEMRDTFLNEIKQFVGSYNNTATIRNSYGQSMLDTKNNNYSVQFVSGWCVSLRMIIIRCIYIQDAGCHALAISNYLTVLTMNGRRITKIIILHMDTYSLYTALPVRIVLQTLWLSHRWVTFICFPVNCFTVSIHSRLRVNVDPLV